MRRAAIALLWALPGLPVLAQFPGTDVTPQLKLHQFRVFAPLTPFNEVIDIERDLFLTRGGSFFYYEVDRTFRVDAWDPPASTLALGMAPFPLLAALNQDLAAAHVASLHGPCRPGFLKPGEQIIVSWYGRYHLATQLVLSADPSLPDCSAGVVAVVDAASRFQTAVLADPSTQVLMSPH
jgi:hypothetical protein